MCSVEEMQHIDRELSSELVESPINPAFLNISAPLMGSNNPLFYLQLNGEGLWQWRKLHSPNQVFDNSRVGMAVSEPASNKVLSEIFQTHFSFHDASATTAYS